MKSERLSIRRETQCNVKSGVFLLFDEYNNNYLYIYIYINIPYYHYSISVSWVEQTQSADDIYIYIYIHLKSVVPGMEFHCKPTVKKCEYI